MFTATSDDDGQFTTPPYTVSNNTGHASGTLSCHVIYLQHTCMYKWARWKS